ncbi:hypothetical protein [Sedimenticola sp.]|uniref:hypothetical protein n=1 Tax=Sedimenticola sp. TaxID=1940285 RepID=UPI002584125F|nr:hypothetical protein [Sedimenticola sp.]MCW8904490.1 hypothetical protein [Sedimenticola sp.]
MTNRCGQLRNGRYSHCAEVERVEDVWRQDQQSTCEERDRFQEKPSPFNREQRRPQPIRMLVNSLKLSG